MKPNWLASVQESAIRTPVSQWSRIAGVLDLAPAVNVVLLLVILWLPNGLASLPSRLRTKRGRRAA